MFDTHLFSLWLFADDTTTMNSKRSTQTICNGILHTLERYFNKWKLKINSSKTEVIIFTKQRSIRGPNADAKELKFSRAIHAFRIIFQNYEHGD